MGQHQMKEMGGKSVIIRLDISGDRMNFGLVANIVSSLGGDIVAIDTIHIGNEGSVRDMTVNVVDASGIQLILEAIGKIPGIRVVNTSDRTFLLHLGGKIEVTPKVTIQNRDDLSRVYTPDVARVCAAIQEDPDKAFSLTVKRNTVAVVSDGTAVLGLGDIGPKAAMPVMEGKAMLFKQFAGVDAFPICLETTDPDEIVRTVKAISPAFGGINLEDISSPRCFEIEERLREELDIPVFHDDQHGTAVVTYAGLINALKIAGKTLADATVVVCGIGAAGVAISKILLSAGVKELIGVDKEGILVQGETYSNPVKTAYAEYTNPNRRTGTLRDALAGADVFVGVSAGGMLSREDVQRMAPNPVVFAMANPSPEILPGDIDDIVAVAATGRSDYPNQINNVLCFPGIFRAVLDCRATTINEEMKLAAAEAIASVIPDDKLSKYYIIPSVFDQSVVERIRDRVVRAAMASGAARRIPKEYR
ncbi:malate dehydrogenase (oxaloacetate-decarboxylating) [Cohnella sp. SGD-V74]|uniref:NAD-dependent malic enzyme n=1 Tax=unclassified Cohnella TaxID=2636738 RepID=UPI000D46F6A3|nr:MULTISPECIES: NAD-dependent malic enzyme [unclassified Cohnella]PRX66403.1 malate dehydrogenase (oxaloacetate-decarboxylating) [Cohnella sp. SGD-V74]